MQDIDSLSAAARAFWRANLALMIARAEASAQGDLTQQDIFDAIAEGFLAGQRDAEANG